ncbi:hypothetical protein ABPG74_022223 [Tetrahymena malaccensis]
MNRLIRLSLRKSFTNREEYESIFTRLFKKSARNSIQKVNPMTGQTNKKNPIIALLEDPEPDEKMKDLTQYDPRNRITMSVKEDKEIFLEENKDISDLERNRMQNIDKALGTKTVFHEIKTYEERLDSEHVMERKLVKLEQGRIKKTAIDRLLTTDPQKKRDLPRIRNFSEFSKRMIDIRIYPQHEKESAVLKTDFETLVDQYSYLQLNKNKTTTEIESMSEQIEAKENSQTQFENEMIQKKIDSFIQKENMYSDMSLIKVSQLEDTLLNDLKKKTDIHDNVPLYTDKFIYYNRDPRVTKECPLSLYRTSLQKFKFKPFDIMEVNPENNEEEQVINKQEILNFLENYLEFDKRIEHLADEIELGNVMFQEIIYSPEHDYISFIFDIYNNNQEYIMIIKDMNSKKFIPRIFSNIDDTVAYDCFDNIYLSQKNDLGRFSIISSLNLKDPEISKIQPKTIIEEKNPNFQFRIRQISNKDVILIDSCSIGGNDQNQLYFKETYMPNTDFRLILDRTDDTSTKLKMGDTSVFYTQSYKNERPTKLFMNNYTKGSRELLEMKQSQETKPSVVNINEVYKEAKKMVESNTLSTGTLKSQFLEMVQKEKYQAIEVSLNKELFFEAGKDEYIKHFEVFQHYVAILVSKMPEQKDYIKIYNFKTKSFHTLHFQEDLYDIQPESNQYYTSNSYNFTLMTPNQPQNFISYNMAMRDCQSYHLRLFVNFQSQNYQMERLQAKSRDGQEIPFTLVYNKQYVNANSPCILYLNQEESSRGAYDLTPNMVSLLDRGVIIAYPHMRGTYDMGEEWFKDGCAERRLTNFCDLIDVAKYIKEQEISTKICGYSTTPLSGLSLFMAVLNEPNLIRCSVYHNGMFDIIEYLQNNQNADSVKIFGDVKFDQDIYEFVKEYSPYQQDLSEINFENMMFTCNSKHPLAYQTRKLVAKLRENKENTEVYFREYLSMPQQSQEIQQFAFLLSIAFYSMDADKKTYIKPEEKDYGDDIDDFRK